MKRSSPKTQQSTAEEGKVGEHTYIQNVYSSPLPPQDPEPQEKDALSAPCAAPR